MILGVISIVLGIIIFLINVLMSPESAMQQTVQYLGYVCASIFITGGFIIITISTKVVDGFNNIIALLNKEKIQEKKQNDNSEHLANVNPIDEKYSESVEEKDKNAEIERLEKLFNSSTDEDEKGNIAKKLYELGKIYYWRFIPK